MTPRNRQRLRFFAFCVVIYGVSRLAKDEPFNPWNMALYLVICITIDEIWRNLLEGFFRGPNRKEQ